MFFTFLTLSFVGLIAYLLNRNLFRDPNRWFTVYDSTRLPHGVSVHTHKITDVKAYLPAEAAWRARRAGYRLADEIESKAPKGKLARDLKGTPLYFAIYRDKNGRPSEYPSVPRDGFSLKEIESAPRFVFLVKEETASTRTSRAEPVAA